MKYYVQFLFGAITCSIVFGQLEPEIVTKFGSVRGIWLKTAWGADIAGFLGIPYAQPPIGKLRFENPQPWTEKWDGVLNATSDGSECLQLDDTLGVIGDEDCLYLNVFTPNISRNESDTQKRKLSVLVFVHGGSFIRGSSNSTLFSPAYLLDHDIIVVTMNYRLNLLGFFSTGNEVTPGNYGLKDVALALRWIQENIDHFGGNPKSVTLVGQSSGAGTAHLLTYSKATDGLFHKVITMSGSSLATWALHSRDDIRNSSMYVASLVGCQTNETDTFDDLGSGDGDSYVTTIEPEFANDVNHKDRKIVECMKKANASDIVRLGYYYVWRRNPVCIFGPTLEAEVDGAIVTVHPEQSIREGLFKDIPWITGVTDDEGLLKTTDLLLNSEIRDELLQDFDSLLVPYVLEIGRSFDNVTAVTEAIKDFYFNGDVVTNLESNITQLVGDALITWASYDNLQKQVAKMKSNVYFYVFAYEGTFSTTFRWGIPFRFGVSHGDEVNYLFPYLNARYADLQLFNTEADRTIINIMSEMWANFAKTGIPSARLTETWEPYQKHHQFLRFGDGRSTDRSLETNFLADRMTFWSELTKNYSTPVKEYRVNQPNDDKNGSKGAAATVYNVYYVFYIYIFVLSFMF